MMPPPSFVDELLALPDSPAQRQFLRDHADLLDDEAADALKKQADHFLRSDVQRSLRVADLLQYAGELADNPSYQALGLIAEGNARCIGGLGEYEQAIELYDRAAALCRAEQHEVGEARAQIGKFYALMMLGEYDAALRVAEWADKVLQQHGQWLLLGRVRVNRAIIHARRREDARALELYSQARDFYLRAGPEATADLAHLEINRSDALRYMGQFDESIAAGQTAWGKLSELGQHVAAARAQMNLAITHFVQGRYNEALALFDKAREVFVADGRQRDAIKVDLWITDCLLQLSRFADVITTGRQARDLFTELGTSLEVGMALLKEAEAFTGLEQYTEALNSLTSARSIFAAEGDQVWVAIVDLHMAIVSYHQGHFQRGLDLATACANVFSQLEMPVEQARAYLAGSRAAMACSRPREARDLVTRALGIGERNGIPPLNYQGYHISGSLAQGEGNLEEAYHEFERGISELERLRSRLMVEFRADFVEDKQVIYEDIVDLALDLERPHDALEYAERAKSRALLDMLAYRIDLSLKARNASDQPLVDELERLQAERNRLYRHWEGRDGLAVRGWTSGENEDFPVQQDVLALEKRITDLWHKLLVRNADYARDAALWQVRSEKMEDYLPPGTMVLEYFTAHDRLIAFLVTRDAVDAQRLPWDRAQVQHLIKVLRRNFALVQRSAPDQIPALTAHARHILRDLHELVLAPVADQLEGHPHVIIVPHGPLHYVPFHALCDGQSHWLERQVLSYLPNSSLLRHLHGATAPENGAAWAFGHSHNGELPHAEQEAEAVAQVLSGQVAVDGDVTLARLRQVAANCRILHLATHATFHADNPLFSGLALAGQEWLTTLDVFNLPLSASLVTLSACQTGQHVVGGGDELLGLMRAFLYAGAASLVLTHWAVEDRCTMQLMQGFYRRLQAGQSQVAALRDAQLELLHGAGATDQSPHYRHPYFWAPFYLVGNTGAVAQGGPYPAP